MMHYLHGFTYIPSVMHYFYGFTYILSMMHYLKDIHSSLPSDDEGCHTGGAVVTALVVNVVCTEGFASNGVYVQLVLDKESLSSESECPKVV